MPQSVTEDCRGTRERRGRREAHCRCSRAAIRLDGGRRVRSAGFGPRMTRRPLPLPFPVVSPRGFRANRDPAVRALDRRTATLGLSWSTAVDGSVPVRPLVTGTPAQVVVSYDAAQGAARGFSARWSCAWFVDGRQVQGYRHRTRTTGWASWAVPDGQFVALLRLGRTMQVRLADALMGLGSNAPPVPEA